MSCCTSGGELLIEFEVVGRGCGSMVERGLPKPETRVRFPSPAPTPIPSNKIRHSGENGNCKNVKVRIKVRMEALIGAGSAEERRVFAGWSNTLRKNRGGNVRASDFQLQTCC